MRKYGRELVSAALALMLLSACSAAPLQQEQPAVEAVAVHSGQQDYSFTDRELDGTWNEAEAKPLEDISKPIEAEGTYLLKGSYTGTLTVAAGDKDKIQIVLDSAEIYAENGPAIYVESADKVFITAAAGSRNVLSDAGSYSEAYLASGADAAVFSRADLCINGTGSIEICGNYAHGTVSKDDLCVVSAELDVKAKKTALAGKDCVKLYSALGEIQAGTDGIRSDNAEDSSRGYVYMDSARLSISSGKSGVQAETVLLAKDCFVDIVSGGGSEGPNDGQASCKGMEAGALLEIEGGEYRIDSFDDSLHSNGTVEILSGSFELSSADDGIHADSELKISDGSINIAGSFEGLEAEKIYVAGGRISLTAADDGLNAAGGMDGSGKRGPVGPDSFMQSSGEIHISGGYVHINAGGDGIDSNGSLEISGGSCIVSGPVSGENSVLDYAQQANISGGLLIAVGSRGMAQSIAADEDRGVIACAFNTQTAGTSFVLTDSRGEAVVAYTPPKDYECAIISAPGIIQGESYSVVLGAEVFGADENGFAESPEYSGGTVAGSLEADEGDGSGSEFGPGGMPGGMGGPGGPGLPGGPGRPAG